MRIRGSVGGREKGSLRRRECEREDVRKLIMKLDTQNKRKLS